MNNISLGFILMGYGLVGVFTTLILFIIMIWLVTKFFPPEDTSSGQ